MQEPPQPTREEAAVRAAFCRLADLAHFRNTGGVPRHRSYADEVLTTWDGGTSAAGRNYQPAWGRYLDLCARLGVNPLEHLEYVFDQWREAAPPAANTLCSESQLIAFSRLPPQTEAITIDFSIQQREARARYLAAVRDYGSQASPTICHAAVTFNVAPPLTALFRYAYGLEQRLPGLPVPLRTAAALQYAPKRKLYDAVWGNFIPAEFRSATLTDLYSMAGIANV